MMIFQKNLTLIRFILKQDIKFLNRKNLQQILAFLVLVFFNVFICKAQSTCLCHNNTEHPNIVFDALVEIDSCFKGRSLFFGEYHEVYGLSEIKYSLITFLNQNYGHQDIVMEIGFSAAFLYNKFLETGDTNFITSPQLTYVNSKSEMNFWLRLFQYNKSLPTEKKLIIHGYDFERSELMKFLFLHLPDKEIPIELISTIVLIEDYKNTKFNSPSDFQIIHEEIKRDFDIQEELFKKYFDKDYAIIKQILNNEYGESSVIERNKTMFSYLSKENYYISQKPFICFMGSSHTVKYDNNSFYNLVANDTSYKSKSTTISLLIKDLQSRGYQHNKVKFAYHCFKKLNDQICKNLFLKFNSNCEFSLISAAQIPLKSTNDFPDFILLMTDRENDN